MAETESRSREDESSGANTDSDESAVTSPHKCHETVDPETRDAVLAEYGHRCQVCGRCGPEKGGLATLHVHHIERDLDEMDEHNMENLTLLCRSCHSWFHQQSTPDDSPVEITEEDQGVLLPQDIEILRYLAENGPDRTGDIASGLPSDHSVPAIRERLWVLMGLDNLVEARDQQIVDKDVETGEWGLTEQIENSARGHIPESPQLLLQRMEDEQVRQALNREVDRQKVMDVLDMSRRTTFNKAKRANAYDFPLDAFSRGGRPPDDERSEPSTATTDTTQGEPDAQQRLDAVPEQHPDSLSQTETGETTEPTPETRASDRGVETAGQAMSENGADDDLRVHLQNAIDALQEVEQGL